MHRLSRIKWTKHNVGFLASSICSFEGQRDRIVQPYSRTGWLNTNVNRTRVLIVVANGLVRDSLQSILELEDSIQVIGSAVDADELERRLRSEQPDVVIMDHDSPGWLEMVRRIRAFKGQVRCLLLSAFMDESSGAMPLEDNNAWVMAKSSPPAQLFQVIQQRTDPVSTSRIVTERGATAAAEVVVPQTGRSERPAALAVDKLSAIDQRLGTEAQAQLAIEEVERKAGKLSRLLPFGLHTVSLALLAAVFAPLAQWYSSTPLPLGLDSLHFVYYVNYLQNNFGLFTSMWKYTWYAGAPFSREYPMLHMYATLPLASYFGDVVGSQIYLLAALFAFSVVCYFLYFALSGNHFLSVALAGITLWSPNTLNALVRDGWASFSASQVFFVLAFLLLVKYFQNGNRKLAVAAAAVCGVAFGGHAAMGAIASMFSYGFLLLGQVFWPSRSKSSRWPMLLLYPAIAAGVGSAFAFPFLASNYAAIGLKIHLTEDVKEAFPLALSGLPDSSNLLVFVFLGIVLLLAAPKWRRVVRVRSSSPIYPLVGIIIFLGLLLVGYQIGRNPMESLGGPNRVWWIGTILIGCFISSLSFSVSNTAEGEHHGRRGPTWKSHMVKVFLSFVFIALVVASPSVSFEKIKGMVMSPVAPTEGAFQALRSLGMNEISNDGLTEDLPPSVDVQSIQHRVWIGDPGLGLIWNMLFPMPTTKGYFYQALYPSWDYWREVSVSGGLTKNEGVPDRLARNNALFHLDWYAVKYLANPDLVAPYLTVGLAKREKGNGFAFWEVNNPSSIVQPTNAPAILVVGDSVGYDVMMRTFATKNLNSQQYILVRGPEMVDSLDPDKLADFDGIILYNYRYGERKKALGILLGFVDRGGGLMIETGSEVQDSVADSLGDPFPIGSLERDEVKGDWGFEATLNPITEKIDPGSFSSPSYDGYPWKVSYVSSEKLVKPWARAILKQEGKPVIVAGQMGKGKVVWGGLNLPYHLLSYHNEAEADLFENIVRWTFGNEVSSPPKYSVSRPRPELVSVSGEGFRGVLFREYVFPGWSASVSGGEGAESRAIYRAGPDLMYVRMPGRGSGPVETRFAFGGPPSDWAALVVSILSVLLVLDYLLFSRGVVMRCGLRLLRFGARATIGRVVERFTRDDEAQ